MRESKFIELLNLYIDGEISPRDAADLELAIQRSRRFRRIYGEYCRIHRATRLLSESFRRDAPERFMREPDTEVMLARSRRFFRINQFAPALGGLAAAFVVMVGGYVYMTRLPAPTANTVGVNGAITAAVPTVASTDTSTQQTASAATPIFASVSNPNAGYMELVPGADGTLIRAQWRPDGQLPAPQQDFPVVTLPSEHELWSPPMIDFYSGNRDSSRQNRFYSSNRNRTGTYGSTQVQPVSFEFQK